MRYLFAIAAFALSVSTLPAADPARVDFNRDVRPILADHCYQCHGPDEAKRKAKLRLDIDPAAQNRDPVIVHGKPDESELIRRISTDDARDRMPPVKFDRPLNAKQIETLKAWVKQGGKWEMHWAFIPPQKGEIPTAKHQIHNPIDAFVFARLEKEGLSPSPEADRATLIRRMTFDLTGLPPTPAEVEAFVKDNSPQAVDRLADRLLASPRYGERMAWRWLEAARYADTHGYQTDGERQMWRWRDWVIEAYNRNMPYDQFTIEQLAGDLLPKPTLDQRIATGFNRNHRGNSEGGIVPEEYAVEYVVDRVETTATVWLGLTLGCARCHDHKFDPFSQKEFYQIYAYFNSIPEKGRAVKFGNSPPYIKAPTRAEQKQLAELDARIKAVEGVWDALQPRIIAAQEEWERVGKQRIAGEWLPREGRLNRWPLTPKASPTVREGKLAFAPGRALHPAGRSHQAPVFDGKLFLDAGNIGDFGFDDHFSFAVWVKPKKLTGAILSRMAEEPQSDGYSVELVDGKVRVCLTKRWLDDALRVETAKPVASDKWQHIAVTYDGSRLAAGVKVYIDGIEQQTAVLLDELNQSFDTKEPFRIGTAGGKQNRFVGQMQDITIFGRVLDREEITIHTVPWDIGTLLHLPDAERTAGDRAKIRAFFLQVGVSPLMNRYFEALRGLRAERAKLWESISTVMVMEELPQPREAFVLKRGEYDKKGEKVNRAVPATLHSFPKDAPNDRLGLAKWLVDPKNPLTARVAVNRIWQLHFGTGLVRTAEDFGTQGAYPSHPELLDWLATEFIRSGWDVKHLHKLIVTSATYRQTSRITKELLERDPDNTLLARGPRLRLSAEMLRDQALFASGLLVEKQGGPSVKPYQPAGLWNELTGTGEYQQDHGEKLYRRSLYTYWKRTVPPPTLGVFDTSMRETCWVRETRTNTPLHALTLLNDVTFVEAARVLAQRVMKDEATPEKRIAKAFQYLTARTPTASEAKVLRAAYERQLATYRKDPAAAAKLLRVGESKPEPKLNAAELAAYANVCSLILNLDEAVTKE